MFRKIFVGIARVILFLIVLSWIFVGVYRFFPVWITPLMVIRLGESIAGDGGKVRQTWVPYEQISHSMVLAVIAAEDQKFPIHRGFDWDAIKQAREEIATGRRFRGGSTISNQAAKNVFLWPGRNLLRKGLEAYFTLLIEAVWGKKRIMEVYLNAIEMGDGIFGVEEASRAYFNKSAKDLSRQEAALLTAILPNPRRWNPTNPTSYLRGRQTWILRNMNNLGKIEL